MVLNTEVWRSTHLYYFYILAPYGTTAIYNKDFLKWNRSDAFFNQEIWILRQNSTISIFYIVPVVKIPVIQTRAKPKHEFKYVGEGVTQLQIWRVRWTHNWEYKATAFCLCGGVWKCLKGRFVMIKIPKYFKKIPELKTTYIYALLTGSHWCSTLRPSPQAQALLRQVLSNRLSNISALYMLKRSYFTVLLLYICLEWMITNDGDDVKCICFKTHTHISLLLQSAPPLSTGRERDEHDKIEERGEKSSKKEKTKLKVNNDFPF